MTCVCSLGTVPHLNAVYSILVRPSDPTVRLDCAEKDAENFENVNLELLSLKHFLARRQVPSRLDRLRWCIGIQRSVSWAQA